MRVKQIVPSVYAISLSFVNTFVIDADDLTLIDTGVPGSVERIVAAVRALGKQPTDIKHILLTHCHADHTGSLQALKAVTNAQAWMHPAAAALARVGQAGRPIQPAPGLFNKLIVRLLMARHVPMTTPAVAIEHEVRDGDKLMLAGGIRVIGTPGHTAGHVSFLWPNQGGVLFVGDAAGNMFGLDYAPIYEDFQVGQQSLAKLASLDFEVACFGHGCAITTGASQRFRDIWAHSKAIRDTNQAEHTMHQG